MTKWHHLLSEFSPKRPKIHLTSMRCSSAQRLGISLGAVQRHSQCSTLRCQELGTESSFRNGKWPAISLKGLKEVSRQRAEGKRKTPSWGLPISILYLSLEIGQQQQTAWRYSRTCVVGFFRRRASLTNIHRDLQGHFFRYTPPCPNHSKSIVKYHWVAL